MALVDLLRDEKVRNNLKTLSVYNSEGLKGGKFQASFRLPSNNWIFEYGETPEQALEKVTQAAHECLSRIDMDRSVEYDTEDLF